MNRQPHADLFEDYAAELSRPRQIDISGFCAVGASACF
jgi:hypothetical protein